MKHDGDDREGGGDEAKGVDEEVEVGNDLMVGIMDKAGKQVWDMVERIEREVVVMSRLEKERSE